MMAAIDEDEAPDEVVVECEIDATPERLWHALTDEALATDWLGASPAAGESNGATYSIIEAEPYSRIRYSWHDPACPDAPPVVTVELERLAGGSTRFRLTHGRTEARTPHMSAANTNGPPLARAA